VAFGLRGQWLATLDGPVDGADLSDLAKADWAGHLLVFGDSDSEDDFGPAADGANAALTTELHKVTTGAADAMVIDLDAIHLRPSDQVANKVSSEDGGLSRRVQSSRRNQDEGFGVHTFDDDQ
jgi:hypothetical protein